MDQPDAKAVLELLLSRSCWVRRRTHLVELLLTGDVRRSQIMHFTVPASTESPCQTRPFLPLDEMTNGPRAGEYLTDESKRHLPVLSHVESRQLAGQMLRADALSVEAQLDEGVLQEILEMPSQVDKAGKILARWRSADDPPWNTLMNSSSFQQLSSVFAFGFPLVALPKARAGVPRTWEHGFTEPASERAQGWKSRLIAFGLRARTLKVEQVSLAAKHLEIAVAAPRDVEIISARLVFSSPRGTKETDAPAHSARADESVPKVIDLPTDRMLSKVTPDHVGDGLIELDIRAGRGGVLLTGLLNSILVLLLIIGIRLRLTEFSSASSSSAPLLVLVPALLGAYLARHNEARFATGMLTGVRAVILTSAGIAVLATYLIAAGLMDATLWTALAVAAGVPVLILALSNVLPRAKRA